MIMTSGALITILSLHLRIIGWHGCALVPQVITLGFHPTEWLYVHQLQHAKHLGPGVLHTECQYLHREH